MFTSCLDYNADILNSAALFLSIKQNYRNLSNISTTKLDPNWITGFTDAEGCFTVSLSKLFNKKWRAIVSFEINLHIKDIEILYLIKIFFGVGNIYSSEKRSSCVYRVTNIEDLIDVIIPHFTKFTLLTEKYSDFILWSKVVELMSLKQHLTSKGFKTILTYYASINKGISDSVSKAFSDIKPANRTKPVLPHTLNPYWVSGFTAGDGGFSIGIRAITGQIYFRFHIAQHSRDILLMNLLITFFKCGKVHLRSNLNRCDFYIQDFNNIYNIIIPQFDTYPLNNIKHLDFADYKKAANLFKSKGLDSREEIKEIISNLNSKRKH